MRLRKVQCGSVEDGCKRGNRAVQTKMPKKSSKFAIQVAVRVRPLLSHDRSQNATVQTRGDVVCALDPEKLYGVVGCEPLSPRDVETARAVAAWPKVENKVSWSRVVA